MVDFQQKVLGLNLIVPAIFWVLYFIKATRNRPFHLRWFKWRLFFGHLIPFAMIVLLLLSEDLILLILNVVVIGLLVIMMYSPMIYVLFSDAGYAVIVGRILLREKGLPSSHGKVLNFSDTDTKS